MAKYKANIKALNRPSPYFSHFSISLKTESKTMLSTFPPLSLYLRHGEKVEEPQPPHPAAMARETLPETPSGLSPPLSSTTSSLIPTQKPKTPPIQTLNLRKMKVLPLTVAPSDSGEEATNRSLPKAWTGGGSRDWRRQWLSLGFQKPYRVDTGSGRIQILGRFGFGLQSGAGLAAWSNVVVGYAIVVLGVLLMFEYRGVQE
ncbi:uncharacterized protein LOC120134400 [Hibiscus syriacus]|uniref:uncharacterized protein LOC120134400 n=1 Tax=Hibiscus syriacus TaxID=106335 RepID=UPI001920525C|nr:uncharacterized protein LOC120134400 [Hibiscus syriacus]